MATYIQGNDIHIWLGEESGSTLVVNNQQSDSPYWHFLMIGQPAIGDKVTLHLQDSAMHMFDQEFIAETTDLQDLLDMIEAAVDASEDFSAAPADGSTWGIEGIGLDFTSIEGGAVLGSVSVEPAEIDYNVLACTKSDVLNGENEMLEITETEIKNTNFIPTFQSISLSIEQAIVVDAAGMVATDTIEDWFFAQTKIAYKFIRPNGATTRVISGSCYIKSQSLQGGVNSGGLANFDMVCVGFATIQNI